MKKFLKTSKKMIEVNFYHYLNNFILITDYLIKRVRDFSN